nr:MAG TPA: hypothetical protein [Caudoviricetes sp.]
MEQLKKPLLQLKRMNMLLSLKILFYRLYQA